MREFDPNALASLAERYGKALSRRPILIDEVAAIMPDLCALLGDAFGRVTLRGPFRGLDVGTMENFASFLLGAYELELHEWFEALIAANPRRVVNVGCGEGVYAAGFASRLPEAEIIGFDQVPAKLDSAARLLRANGLSGRVDLRHGANPAQFAAALSPGCVVLMDCEGAEYLLLDPSQVPALGACAILVEVHDFIVPGVSDLLLKRFCRSHAIQRRSNVPRDPRRYPELAGMQPALGHLALNEFRPAMEWFLLEPL
ncbi:MAG: methyltransferase [Alphaproteobacteria bacterium]|nr:methyltransferase [Alphaproteobacteria bacterium]